MKVINTILLSLTLLILVSCSSKDTRDKRGEKYGGSLRINSSSIPNLVFPGKIDKSSESLIVNQVYDGLVKYHTRTLEVIPAIAKSWRVEENGTLYTFSLRDDAYFHDDKCFSGNKGRKIVASDFKYSLEQIVRDLDEKRKPNSQIRNIVGFDEFYNNNPQIEIKGITTPNDTTLIFKLLEQDAMFIHFLAGNYGLVYPKEARELYGLKSTVGSGAYTFNYAEHRGGAITMVANPKYYAHSKSGELLPYLDTINISFITSTHKELELLVKDKTDVVMSLTDEYVTPFLDKHIDDFQSNPPKFVLQQSVDIRNGRRYNVIRSNVKSFDINSQMYFDLSKVYLSDPEPYRIPVNQ